MSPDGEQSEPELQEPLEENWIDEIVTRMGVIMKYEEKIDLDEDVWLITWSPDPKTLPLCEFKLQHQYMLSTLVNYLECCKVGLFCVESTQLGNPHYHGWYQIDPMKELHRIGIIKYMQHSGSVDLKKASSVKIDKYYSKGNALHYYKKEMCMAMFDVMFNPISIETNWIDASPDNLNVISFFTCKKPATGMRFQDIADNRDFLMRLYKEWSFD